MNDYAENIHWELKNNFKQLSQDKTAGLAHNLLIKKKQARVMLT